MSELRERLLDAIYDAPLVDGGWQKALLQVADAFGATDAALYASDAKGQTLTKAVSGRLSQDIHQQYFDDFVSRDTQIVRLLQLAQDRDITGLDLIEDQEDAPCPVHHEYLIPNGISSQIVWLLNGPDRRKYTFALMRDDRFGPFDMTARRHFGLIARHVKRSLHIDSELRKAREEALHDDVVLAQNGIGLITATLSGELRAQNKYAEHLLRNSPTLRDAVAGSLKTASQKFWLESRTPVFQKQVFDPHNRCVLEISIHRPSHANRSPFSEARQGQTTCMVRQVPASREQRLAALREHFSLTATESELASHLLDGGSVSDFAAERGKSIHTARNQMKSLLAKTQTQRQAQLVAALTRQTLP
ncbi:MULTISPECIES: helix-turn-helix transcriptional regulator [unclassified Hyphomonas]|uniref:helix-turn-helix transcriptional regulator n=1 Tax=unclassified Hyphomonas TaxID=2630699 RepID=UPI000458F385|nr:MULTISPECIES: helix-turn-helix transcriptional regulator [unclassified Hyphomonas]KCZ46678.1 hypothetical protein HY17_07995 [Hyphomonas sp. CY54-11-8]